MLYAGIWPAGLSEDPENIPRCLTTKTFIIIIILYFESASTSTDRVEYLCVDRRKYSNQLHLNISTFVQEGSMFAKLCVAALAIMAVAIVNAQSAGAVN